MSSHSIFRLKSALVGGVALGALLASTAVAQPLAFTTPHIATDAGAVSVDFGGQTFVNKGLQGVGRLPATGTLDFAGDTFGAFSSLDVYPGSWRKTATGYTGTLYSLPDRGPNGIGSVNFSDFAGRTSIFAVNLTPYTDTANLPVSADSQHQLALTQTGGFFFKDFNDNLTTGLDPGLPGATSFVVENGMMLPGSTVGAAAGKISLDAEGLRFLSDGSFYVSDEYGAEVYYFDLSGKMQGVIQPPPALIPRDASGQLSYTSMADAATGRRFNQGLEGMAVTPDGQKLVTLLQSATMQDSTTAQQTRTNTRLMVYDISQTNTPTAPIADYVVQLPVYSANGDGTPVNRTAAQSEILALNNTQFLMLSRDGNGLGLANLPPVFKSVMLIDTRGATNIAGTAYENSTTPISPGGVLNADITPVSQMEVVNILNSTQLGKFGINLNNQAPTELTLTEKWEGMTLVPALDEAAPQDFLLLIGNDDDFLSTNCQVDGQDCAQAVNSDAAILVYRLTLPTYVDPQYLQSMIETGSARLGMTAQEARDLTVSYDIAQHLETLRHAAAFQPVPTGAGGVAVWGAGNWLSQSKSSRTTGVQTGSGVLGVDVALDRDVMLGAALGLAWGDSDDDGGFGENHRAAQFSLYGSYQSAGFYGNVTGTYSDLRFTDIDRPAAYGLQATGKADGSGLGFTGEVGYLKSLGTVQFGPLMGVKVIHTDIDGYTEKGAAGGNVIYPKVKGGSTSGYFGGEASAMFGKVQSILRLTYNTDDGYNDKALDLRLASAADEMGTQTIILPGLGQDHLDPSLTLAGTGQLSWWVSYGADIGVNAGVEHHVSAGIRYQL